VARGAASRPDAVWDEVPRRDVARGAASRHDAVWDEVPRRDVARDVARHAARRRASAPARLPVWQARILLRALRPVSSTDLSHPR